MNIILIGMRCSGKSSIAQLMAKKLNMPVVDTDSMICESLKMTIPEIIKQHGWEFFREKEKEIVAKVAKLSNTIISTGGGTIIEQANQAPLKKSGKVIYLDISPDISIKRQLQHGGRPALTNIKSLEEEVNEVYRKRNGIYCESADIIFKRSDDLEKDCTEIIQELSQYDQN